MGARLQASYAHPDEPPTLWFSWQQRVCPHGPAHASPAGTTSSSSWAACTSCCTTTGSMYCLVSGCPRSCSMRHRNSLSRQLRAALSLCTPLTASLRLTLHSPRHHLFTVHAWPCWSVYWVLCAGHGRMAFLGTSEARDQEVARLLAEHGYHQQ
jgi:hypothetical protein